MDWVVDFEGKLGEMETSKVAKDWKKRSIYKVYPCSLGLNQTAYIPQTVAFGPYHHNEKQLQMQMDAHKHRALHHFLKKSNKPLKTYVTAMQSVVPELMASYDNLDAANWQQDTFLLLMLLDGCFMLEILRANKAINNPGDVYGDYDGDADRIFSYHGQVHAIPYIRRDMYMLENQLPMLLLVKLVTIEAIQYEDPVHYLEKLILNFVNPRCKIPKDYVQQDSLHILDLYRKSLLGLERMPEPPEVTLSKEVVDIILPALKLHEAGFDFSSTKTESLLDISFNSKKGMLEVPIIYVDDTTETAYLNLIAFERVHVGAGNEVTTFVSFMDNLIDSAKDVSLVLSKEIIQNHIGSEKAVTNLFNGLSRDMTPDRRKGSLQKVYNEVGHYCKGPWNHWRANLIRTYFRNPWAFISLLAAIFLILLTITQTLYAILCYHGHKC